MRHCAVIFDMDGVMIDSNPYHKKAWKAFCDTHGIRLGEEDLLRNVYGRLGKDALPWIFGRELPDDLVASYSDEINALYRTLYADAIAPVPGLVAFVGLLRGAGVPVAVATSAPPVNVGFVLSRIGLAGSFDIVIDSTAVMRGKPDPEIYLTAARALGTPPETCIVIEDSLSGIEAARRAGMRVIGITTTHAAEELAVCDLVIGDFTGMTIGLLESL